MSSGHRFRRHPPGRKKAVRGIATSWPVMTLYGRVRVLVLGIFMLAHGCATPFSHVELDRSIARVRLAYPELDGKPIAVHSFDEDGVFFASNFSPYSIGGTLQYEIHVNPRAFDLGLAGDALDGVIAHELAHTLDFERRPLAEIGAHLLIDEQGFERRTDLIAIDRGYGRQLLAYRIWQFRVLTRKQIETKKRIYYGPLEMALLLDVKARCPALFHGFLSRPPRSARQIATRCP